VGVAQAILHRPRILILDEPTNGLDPSQTQHMRELIERLAETATVILSTHIMQEVDAICDRAIILRGGGLVLDERLADLKESNRYQLRSQSDANLSALLSGLAPATDVHDMGGGNWDVLFEGDQDSAGRAIAEAVIGADLPLYELAIRRRDLETVFREVNAVPVEEVNDAA
jgi:ABC-2 type transport system ATP-binding protein